MTVELIEPLGSNVEYHFTFHVSRMDSCWYATKNIGAYFSPNVPNATLPDLLNVAPQVEYGGTSFLIDNNGWTRIDGIFTANGGEKYLTIGNFDNDENTDSLFVSGGGVFRPNQPDFYKTAYYYIDEVSLIPDSVYLDVGEIDERETPMNIYPNPASKLLAIEYANFIQSISVFDMFGRLVMQTDGSKQKQIEISVEALTHGIYNVVVVDDKGQRQTRRILKK
jgi:hypothetical protein